MIDLVLMVVIGVSALLGLLRGFVGIVVSTSAWLLAGWASFQFGAATGAWLSADGPPSAAEVFGGYVLSFVGVLLVVFMLGAVLRSTLHATRLSGLDRTLGFGLGLVRGAFFASVLVLLMGFTPFTRETSWRQSQVLPLLAPGAGWMRSRLPDWSAPHIDLPGNPLTSDNGGVEQPSGAVLSGASLENAMSQLFDPARNPSSRQPAIDRDPAQVGAAAKDPAQAGSGEVDPANVDAHRRAPARSQ